MFVYHSTLDVIVKKDKGTDYVLSWESKALFKRTSKRKLLYTAFLHSIKFSGLWVRIKFDKDPLAINKRFMQPKL